jgi:hypothetical protein
VVVKGETASVAANKDVSEVYPQLYLSRSIEVYKLR